MTKKQTQLLYLTATLPPSDEKEFYRLMGLEELDNLGQVNLFRNQTSRKNIGYSVLEYRKKDEDEAVRILVEEKKKEYSMPGQIIVYCSTIDQAVRLGGVLRCQTFHRNIGDMHEKKRILDMLTRGTEQVFTATNALGLGIDAPSIRVVIHVGMRQKLRDYAQESGRAGRDGQKSEAIVMRAVFSDHQGRRRIDQGYKDTEDEMKAFVNGEKCRRIIMDQKMDGRTDRLGCEIGEVKCDICFSMPRGTRRKRSIGTDSDRPHQRLRITQDFPSNEEEETSEIEFSGETSRLIHKEWFNTNPSSEIEFNSLIDPGDQEEPDLYQDEEFREWEEIVRRHERNQERRVEQQCEEGSWISDLETKLEKWKYGCVICRVKTDEEHDHPWEKCPIGHRRENIEKMHSIMQKMRGLKFESYSGCFNCGVPQSICHRWIEDVTKGAGKYKIQRGIECQFKGVVFRSSMAMIQLGNQEIIEWSKKESGKVNLGRNNVEDIQKWLGSKTKIGLVETNQMCKLFQRWA
ncbi:hypothetical protein K3495_g14226 [Podosphaera aphanis]|nr:hypothetical protein K3495_g14226 [Podosphaera aphanis]